MLDIMYQRVSDDHVSNKNKCLPCSANAIKDTAILSNVIIIIIIIRMSILLYFSVSVI